MTRMAMPFVSLLLAGSVLSGCAVGYNRTLFVTRTNVGFEASSTPPVVQLNIARTEGVVGPQFENGKKLPVMASFKFKTSGAFSPAVGSAFATGDAATTMSALYDNPTPPGDWESRARMVKGTLPTDSTLELTNAPTITLPFPMNFFTPSFQKSDVRPVFFGTETSLGLKIAWSGMTGSFPDSAKFGYNRSELAFVPIALEDKKVRMSSLMATLDSGMPDAAPAEIGATTGGAPRTPNGSKGVTGPSLKYQHLQYFATGHAATLLAMQRDVRMAMLARLDPNQEFHKSLFKSGERAKTVAFTLLNPLYAQLRKETGSTAKALADRMDTLEPVGLTYDFTSYTYDGRNLSDAGRFPPLTGRPFERLHTYYSNLTLMIRTLEMALVDEGLSQFNGAPIADRSTMRKQLYDEVDRLKQKRTDLEKRIQHNGAVLSDAVDYFYR